VTPSESLLPISGSCFLLVTLLTLGLSKGTGVAKVGWGRAILEPLYYQLDTGNVSGHGELATLAKWWFSSRGADFQPVGMGWI